MSNAPDAFREVSRRLLKKPDPGLLLRLNEAQETLEAVRADLAELSGLDLHRSLGDHLDAIRDKVAPTRHIRDRRYHSPSPFIRPGGDSHE